MTRNTLVFFCLIFFTNHISSQISKGKDISNSTNFPEDVKAFDLDGDGDKDILTGSHGENNVVWFENFGNGVFSKKKIIVRNVDSYGIYAADLDNDGDLDIISSSYSDGKIIWVENLSGGIFDTVQIVVSNNAEGPSVISTDIDNDGDFDIISANSDDDNIVIHENLGAGVFNSGLVVASNIDGAADVYAADIDNDGDEDLLYTSANDLLAGLKWSENLGNLSFGSQQLISSNLPSVRTVYAADIDNDGFKDVISGSWFNGKVVWFKNLGNGAIDTTFQLISDNIVYLQSVFAADLDNDGDSDVLSASTSDDKLVWYENVGGVVDTTQKIISPNAFSPDYVYAADLDNDGNVDVISACSDPNIADKVFWCKNLGSANFDTEKLISYDNEAANDIAYGDIDNDGDEDIIAAYAYNKPEKIVWYDNNGHPDFGKQHLISNKVYRPETVFVVDIDSDGDLDVLSASYMGNMIAWHENLGLGVFDTTLNIISSIINGPSDVISYDFDNDNDNDVFAIANGTFSWFENLGGGIIDTTEKIINANTTGGGNSLVFGDIDNDGDEDILAASTDGSGPNQKVVWYENVAGIIDTTQHFISQVADPYSINLGDIDNDNDLDIVVSTLVSNKLFWFENLGGGVIDTNSTLIDSHRFLDTELIDIDNDGDLDIFCVSSSPDEVFWYENTAGVFNVNKNTINKEFGSYRILGADIDNDGDIDVVSSDSKNLLIHENCYYSPKLKGKMFYDINQNSILDTLDIPLPFIQANLSLSSLHSYTDSLGNFLFAIDTGTFVLSYAIDSLWNLSTDSSSYTRTLVTANQIEDSLNFGFYPDTLLTVITPELTGGFPRCNTIVNYNINIRNIGTTIPSGMIRLDLDNDISYVNADIIPDSINGQSIFWHYDSLFFYSDKLINVSILMPPFTSISNILSSYLYVNHTDTNGTIVYSNFDTLQQVSVCAYDPNDKAVSPQGIGTFGFISKNQELEYLIRFQNTGNDTAITVMVRDQLDEDLNWASLNSIVTSHPCRAWVEQDGEAVFKFENIMLPDSNVDFDGSQGFVKFKIKPDSHLIPFSTIHNTSEIYFDLNPAVVTNTVLNTIYDCNNTYSNINDTIFCFGDELYAYTTENFPFNNYSWSLDSLISVSNDSIAWIADSVGVFNLKLSINNSICNKDSLIIVQVNPLPNVSVLDFDPDTLCDNGMPVTLPIGIPSGGNYSGNAVGGGNFDPVIAGAGTHDVIYTYTDTNSCINNDTTVVTVKMCVGVDEIDDDLGILIYPNPNTGLFTIEKPTGIQEAVQVKILDAMSKLIIDKVIPIGKRKLEIDITNYSDGIYYLQLVVGEEVFVKQILKN